MDGPEAVSRRTWWTNFREATLSWRAPVIAGVSTGLASWLVWYFTKVPCIIENAVAGLCNPGVLANYINLPALASCLAIGGGFATFTGGYNIIMLNRERQRADAAEERADAAEERAIRAQERADKIADEVRERLLRIEEQRNEERRLAVEALQEERRLAAEALQEERRLSAEERLQALEERRQIAINDQAMMNTLAEISAILAQLVRQQQNGHAPNDD